MGTNFCAAKGPPVQRKPLKHRDYEVDLESRLGKTQVSIFVLLYLGSLLGFMYMMVKSLVSILL